MKDFIDLPGASGASYRFRLWPEGRAHQPIAGNFVCVRAGEGGAYKVIHVGESTDLSRIRFELPKPLRAADVLVYTRLNIARAARSAEHEDLLARHALSERSRRTVKKDA